MYDTTTMRKDFPLNPNRAYVLITIVITLCLQAACTSPARPGTTLPELSESELSAARTEAASLFSQRTDLDKLREAISILERLRNPDHRNYEVEWTFAKYNYFLGLHSPNGDEAEAALEEGRDAARIAFKVGPNKPEGYFWYGANLGQLAKRSPVTVGLKSVDDIKEAMLKVVEIEPGYQNASAFDALAQVELATRIKGGDSAKAVDYLEKGLAIDGNNSNLRLHLAEAYFALDRNDKAREQIQYLLNMKPNPEYLPEHETAIESAKKLLANKF